MHYWLVGSLLLGAYLLGSVPFGLMLGKLRGIDIRTQGSGNIGATNAGRVLGKKTGYLCLALDILKGLIPAWIGGIFFITPAQAQNEFVLWALIALAPIFGHVFPVFLRFRGGKGVATTIGAALGVIPYLAIPILVSLVGYLAVRKLSGFVSLGSLTIATIFPFATVIMLLVTKKPAPHTTWPLAVAALVMSVLIIVRHRENIERLRQEKELKN